MVHEVIQGTFRQTNLINESAEYLAKREELRLAEIELMRQRERVAELRRHLPPGPVLEDYNFLEGPVNLDSGDTPTRTVRLSELFTAAGRPLVILSPDVRETSDQGVSDVHRLDRRYKRSCSPHCPKRRLGDCRRSRSGGLAGARPRPWLDPAPPVKRRR